MSHKQVLLQYSVTAKQQYKNITNRRLNYSMAETIFTIIHKAKTKHKCDTVFGKAPSQYPRTVDKKNHHFIINPNYTKL